MANRTVWWDNVEFDAFCGHFFGMTPEQIAADITESIGKLLKRDGTGDSFGAIMVRNAKARQESPKAEASRQNGAKGGRPKKAADPEAEKPASENPEPQATDETPAPRPEPERRPAAPQQQPRQQAQPVAQKAAVKKPGQIVWGTFENVYLSQDEYNEVMRLVGNLNSTREMVDSLSAKLEDGSITSSNHYATLVYWANYRKSHAEKDADGDGFGRRYETVSEHNMRVLHQGIEFVKNGGLEKLKNGTF